MAKILPFPSFDAEPSESSEALSIYLTESDLPVELWRAVEIALMASKSTQAIAFKPLAKKNWGGQWVKWVDSDFSEKIAPHLIRARQAASIGVRELAAEDRQFSETLDRDTIERSLAAGLALLTRHVGAKHFNEVTKFGEKIENGICPGHASSVFALHCAAFNVPAASGLIAYLYLEWRTAQSLTGWPIGQEDHQASFEQMTPDLASRLPEWLKSGGDSAFQPRAVE